MNETFPLSELDSELYGRVPESELDLLRAANAAQDNVLRELQAKLDAARDELANTRLWFHSIKREFDTLRSENDALRRELYALKGNKNV